MKPQPKLSSLEQQERLIALNKVTQIPWAIEHSKLHKKFIFKNFVEAFGFMSQVAIHAQKMNHHPEWRNVYKELEVDLVTHHSDGITTLDFELAEKMEDILDGWRNSKS